MEFLMSSINKSIYHSFLVLWFILNIVIAIGNWTGKIRFGLGMGDLVYMGSIGIALIIVTIIYFLDLSIKKNSEVITKGNLLLMGFCLIFLIFIILKMTVLRGLESKWDGRVFF